MAARQVMAAFKQHEVVLAIESLLLQKEIKPAYRKSNTYKQIAASLDNVGLSNLSSYSREDLTTTCCSTATCASTF
jgi:hypothetical protein